MIKNAVVQQAVNLTAARHPLHHGVVPDLQNLTALALEAQVLKVLLGLVVRAPAGHPAVTAAAAEAEIVSREQKPQNERNEAPHQSPPKFM